MVFSKQSVQQILNIYLWNIWRKLGADPQKGPLTFAKMRLMKVRNHFIMTMMTIVIITIIIINFNLP